MAAWHHQPAHYSENPEHRPPPQDIHPPQSYPPPGPPPHPQSGYPPPPPSRENSSHYPSADPYSRGGSVSAPTRSPAEPPRNHYPPPSSAPHEPPYYQQPSDYHRPPPGPYGPPESQSNGGHPPPLHVQTGHEMMPGQPVGHPPPGYPPYGHPHPHSAGPPPTPGGGYPYAVHDPQRRKPIRAAQACDSCRQRKAKCDEGRPECQHCKDNNLKCVYRDVPPQKSEKQVLQINEKLESMENSIQLLLEAQKTQQEMFSKLIESGNFQSASLKPSNTPVQSNRPAISSFKSEDSQIPQKEANGAINDDEDTSKFAMPLKHTTAVHHLFDWPLVKALIPKNQSATYVNDLEISRGLLRLYGCGEGEDKGDGHEGAPSPASSFHSENRSFDDETTSNSPYGVWGNGQLPSLPSSQEHNARDHPGGLGSRGGLLLDADTVDAYFQSYMDNMHTLHPVLEPRTLKKMINTFKKKHSWPNNAVNQITGKRKRDATNSPTPMEDVTPTFVGGRPHPRVVNSNTIEHSVANAIVLLVIALGKICAHREPLPGPASTSNIKTSTPHTMFSTLSDLPYTKSAPASPYNQANGHASGVAASSPSYAQGKNMDVIPGLSYFAKAADIIGELPGGADISHVQANLLAGLYMGQLARINSSHYYFSVACRACIILVESKAYSNNEMHSSRRNLINFAFWSLLQLESDILAEVELPPSGISRYEGSQQKELPNDLTLEPIEESKNSAGILQFYSMQIQLRRTMNDIHSILYSKSKSKFRFQRPVVAMVKILQENLDSWRAMLGDWNWDDDDHESPHINVARMRAKYYGARYIIHRPVLQYCLGLNPPQTPTIKHSDSPQASGNSAFASPIQTSPSTKLGSRRYSEMGPPGRNADPVIEPKILVYAKACVEAAIRSTTAFDKVPKRLIVTNIFGTAHAQFGNMLVLSATYTSPHRELSSLVPEPKLRQLFDRTIDLLNANEAISPVLAKDARILQHVRSQVFKDYASTSMSSSFTSR